MGHTPLMPHPLGATPPDATPPRYQEGNSTSIFMKKMGFLALKMTE